MRVMNIDEVTPAQAEEFWASLDASERQVLCNIDAREHDPRLIAKLAEAGMLFWVDQSVSTRPAGVLEGEAAVPGASAMRVPLLGLARELVVILDEHCSAAQ